MPEFSGARFVGGLTSLAAVPDVGYEHGVVGVVGSVDAAASVDDVASEAVLSAESRVVQNQTPPEITSTAATTPMMTRRCRRARSCSSRR